MRLVFATNNRGKFKEATAILPSSFTLLSLEEFPDASLPEENEDTLEGNALIKARHIHNLYKIPCFADDTGLFIESLDNAPGVHSARFSGQGASSLSNMEKVLNLLDGKDNRKAYFKTVIALIISGKEFLFEGKLIGEITKGLSGHEGFGYDPIFVPTGFTKTLAEMGDEAKNALSHRRRALVQMANFLE